MCLIARRAAVATLACMLGPAVAGCGDGGKSATAPTSVATTTSTVTPTGREPRVAAGQRVFEHGGCLACHRLGTRGNDDPGDNLTGIGERKSRTEILRALVNPTSPMPSYRRLPSGRLDDLVAYLSALRGSAPGGPPCPDDLDCG